MSSNIPIENQRQALLRASIQEIMRNRGLSESEKAKRIQTLMIPNNVQQSDASKETYKISYNDPEKKILGCVHYQLKAQVLAPCCNTWVSCRFCHDQSSDHTMDRFQVSEMRCMLCNEQQPIAQDCRKCKSRMGRYYCHKCRLIDDGPGKEIFHCDKCGICLSGDKSKFYHCETCDACVALSARTKHLCKEKQLHCDCPICGEQIFASTQAIVQTECRHLMHEKCLEKHAEYSFKCPICLASICETQAFFRAIEKYMGTSTMPVEYRDVKSNIHCNDCRQRSVAKYHFLYHKCHLCLSYNTTMLSTFTGTSAKLVG